MSGRLTFITHEIHPHGGHERAGYELIRRLLDAGTAVTVIARRCELPPSERLRWVRVRGPARPFPLAYPWFCLVGTIATAVRGTGARLSVGAIVLNRVDAVTVQFCHRGYSRRPTRDRRSRASRLFALNAYLSSMLSRLGERWCYRPSRATCLVAVSNGVAAELRRCFPRMATRVTVIPNGVDRSEFRPDTNARSEIRRREGLAEDALVAVFVGGDWGRKGLPVAVAGVAATGRWHLVVAGDGDAASARRVAEEQNAGNRLHLLGATRQPARVYAAGDAFLMPTSYEAFSLAMLEAAAAGLPLVVTRAHGAEELVVGGRAGLFIERTPESIREALDALADDPALRHRMGGAARRATERYGWDEIASLYRSLLTEVRDRGSAAGHSGERGYSPGSRSG